MRLPILDHTAQVYGGLEATFGAGPAAAPAAADALRFITFESELAARRLIPNAEQLGHRGMGPPILGGYDPTPIKMVAPLVGSGVAATPPNIGRLLRAAGLLETVGADVLYSRDANPAASAWLARAHKDGSFGQLLAGCLFDGDLAFPDLGTADARIELNGKATRASTVYRNKVAGAVAIGATALPLAEKTWVLAGAPAFVEVTEGANSEVMKVTAVDNSVTPAVATVVRAQAATTAKAFTAAATVRPYAPAPVVPNTAAIGDPQVSLQVDLGAGLVGMQIVKAGLVIKPGLVLWEKEAGSEHILGFAPDRYGDDGCRLTLDAIYTTGDGPAIFHRLRQDQTAIQAVVTVGNVAGNRMVATLPACRVVECNAPAGASGTRKGTIVLSAYGESDVTLKFN